MKRWALLVILFSFAAHSQTSEASNARIGALCKVSHPSDKNVVWGCRRIKKGETLESLFGDRWVDVARFNRIDRRHSYPGISIKVPKNLDDIKEFNPLPVEYPPAENEGKFILVDLSEQYLGAYEYGKLAFSAPAATGEKENETPRGEFKVTASHRYHKSSKYFIEKTETPYPMNHALRFYINREGVTYWIHGRDIPGYPASHGCIGLYDEAMQKKQYKYPKEPVLEDAKKLFEWVLGTPQYDGFQVLKDAPRIKIIGKAP